MIDNNAIKEVFPTAPEFTNEMRIELHREYAKSRLFYRKSRNKTEFFCSHCFEKSEIDYNDSKVQHKSKYICPKCGRLCTCHGVNIGRSSLTETRFICFFVSTTDNEEVYAFCVKLDSWYGHDRTSLEKMEQWYSGSDIVIHKIIRYTKNDAMIGVPRYYGWEIEEKLEEPVCHTHNCYEYYDLYNTSVLYSTFMKYFLNSNFQRIYKSLKYLMYAVKYPAIELLVKNDGTSIINNILDNQPCKQVMDLSGKTYAEIFKTDNNTAAIIKQKIKSTNISLEIVKCFYRLRNLSKNYKIEDAIELAERTISWREWIKILRKTGLTFTKLINYFNKIKIGMYGRAFNDYCDYIGECEKLDYDIKDSQINRPKDFRAAHERTSSIMNAILKEEELRREREREMEYSKLLEVMEKEYSYSDGNFTIVVPKSLVDIVSEGKNLKHCVGGYAELHFERKLTILFLRENSSLETSFITIEMRGWNMIQIRGLKNTTDFSEEVDKFVKNWLAWGKVKNETKTIKSA